MSLNDSIQWTEWGDAAFQRAKNEGKPVLLALTATWCHWCHVMDQTSYSDPKVISLIDAGFIPVRVDVDQRPEISHRYNQGGFPSVAILGEQGELIAGRIYTPPEDMVRFLEMAISQYSGERSADIAMSLPSELPKAVEPGAEITSVLQRLEELYDAGYGGFGMEPKQPPWDGVGLLLEMYGHTKDKNHLKMATNTLDAIRAGLYDQKDQGFFRYSVSRDWRVPHYEKMLVTNAGLAEAYIKAFQLTGRRAYKQSALGALKYMLESLFDQQKGLFYASQDAGEAYYALSWVQREEAEKPRIDRTFYTGWNALAASSLLKAFGSTGDESYLNIATGVLDRVWRQGWSDQGGFAHTLEGPISHTRYLSDQVQALKGFLDLYEATGNPHPLGTAVQVMECIRKLFGAPDGGYHDVCAISSGAGPAMRPILPLLENSLMAEALIRLSVLTGQPCLEQRARETLSLFRGVAPGSSYLGPPGLRRMEEDEEKLYLAAAPAWARAWDMLEHGTVHFVLVGADSDSRTRRLLGAALRVFAPYKVVQVLDPMEDADRVSELGFPIDAPPALYVCMSGMCLSPIHTPAQVRSLASELPWVGFSGFAMPNG
jgi:uncharacterized protein YyaL (SSP411 family)